MPIATVFPRLLCDNIPTDPSCTAYTAPDPHVRAVSILFNGADATIMPMASVSEAYFAINPENPSSLSARFADLTTIQTLPDADGTFDVALLLDRSDVGRVTGAVQDSAGGSAAFYIAYKDAATGQWVRVWSADANNGAQVQFDVGIPKASAAGVVLGVWTATLWQSPVWVNPQFACQRNEPNKTRTEWRAKKKGGG